MHEPGAGLPTRQRPGLHARSSIRSQFPGSVSVSHGDSLGGWLDRGGQRQVLPFPSATRSAAAINLLTRETESPSSFAKAVIVMPHSR